MCTYSITGKQERLLLGRIATNLDSMRIVVNGVFINDKINIATYLRMLDYRIDITAQSRRSPRFVDM